jgi:purine nucleosidase
VGEAIAAMLDFVEKFDVSHYGFEGFPLHDPTVIAYLIEPQMFEARRGYVSVVLDAGAGHGMTVADWWGTTGKAPNATVMLGVDSDRFYELLTDLLARL